MPNLSRSFVLFARWLPFASAAGAVTACVLAEGVLAPDARAAVGPSATAPAVIQPNSPVATEKELQVYSLPDDVKVSDTLISPDNEHVGVVESANGKFRTVVDGVRGPEHDWIIRGSLTFATKGGRFCYQFQDGGKIRVVVGTAGKAWSAEASKEAFFLVGRAVFSADGSRLAYLVQQQEDGPKAIVLDGELQPALDDISGADMQFSPDGKHFVYRALRHPANAPTGNNSPDKDGKSGTRQYYVLDKAPQPASDSVGRFVFSPDGSRWGYAARSADRAWMIVDGKESAKFAFVGGLIFSYDAKQYLYAVESVGPDGKSTGRQALVYNGGSQEKQFQSFDSISAIAFSRDGKRIATTVSDKGKWTVFVDGKSNGAYDGTGDVIFSPDSKRLAVVAARAGKQFLVIDGKELPPCDAITGGAFSPDSTKIAMLAVSAGQQSLYLNDQRLGPASTFAFSPDGGQLAHFSPTSGGKFRLALDGQAFGEEFEIAPPGSRFNWDGPTAAHVLVGRGKQILRVTIETAAGTAGK